MVTPPARYCTEHQPKEKDAERGRGSSTARGYDTAWQRVRLKALKRDSFLCQNCMGLRMMTPATEVHHKARIASHPELRLTLGNLVSVCRACHELLERISH